MEEMIISGAEIRGAFHGQLRKIARMPKMDPGLALLLLSNLGMWGAKLSPDFFGRIDFDPGRTSDDQQRMVRAIIQRGERDIEPPERVGIEEFMVQHNGIRGLRPDREAEKTDVKINEPFDTDSFNYLKTGPGECFKRTEIGNMRFDLFFNLYPFAPFHFILVPEKEKQHSQFFSGEQDFARKALTSAWILVRGCRDPNLRLGFNAMGAHGSVNHFHFHGFFVNPEWQMPIDAFIEENGSLRGWHIKHSVWLPASTPGIVEKTLLHIRRMHELYQRGERVSFNLYITPQGIGIMPRRHQGVSNYFDKMSASGFTTGFAFYELLGEIICPSQAVFDQFLQGKKSGRDIREIFDALSLDENPFAGI